MQRQQDDPASAWILGLMPDGRTRSKFMKTKKELTAPCGLDCFNCELYEDNLTAEFAELINKKMGIPQEDISCRGCRNQDGKHFHLPQGCATLDCVKTRGVDLCCNCSDFPCLYLAPTADQAASRPHNVKVFNLCRIKKIGLDRWIDEETGEIRKRYFTGKFIAGKGQAK
jgi:hypothetical protein